ncbi:hypothetical protein, partial [Aeromonas caviae]|uniref:hypothetical protein n=1 Tax=Aeromonas caviae TaxID=648 RepID=UPI001FC7DD53
MEFGRKEILKALSTYRYSAHKSQRYGDLQTREFNFEVQFPIKNQAAFRSSSKTTCGCLNPKHLRGL